MKKKSVNRRYLYMRFVFCLFMSFVFVATSAQKMSFSTKQLQEKCDSILTEANLLYKFENLAWTSTDMVREQANVRDEIVTYIVYQAADTIKAIFVNEKLESIYELCTLLTGDDYMEDTLIRPLTDDEIDLIYTRNAILNEVSKEKYKVSCPKGYSLNVVLLPFGEDYKLYILTGTSQQNIIPIGNDYLFIADKNGTIKSWKKFHSGFLPVETQTADGYKTVESTHSHLITEPFISATDICTFKLYAPLYDVKTFKVYSRAFSKYFIYNTENDRIDISD